MGKVILVRHSVPEIDPARPAREWMLSAEGRARSASLAENLRFLHAQRIISSIEPKAQETAACLAAPLRLPWKTADGLHEHERPHLPLLPSDAFRKVVASFFQHPDELIFGTETATQSRIRFGSALQRCLTLHPKQNIIIVTHGTVMSLYLAHLTGQDAFEIWQNLKMPDFVVLNSP